ncbi:MAG: NAD(P)-dependent oxidoreductase [Roseivivax sp.]|nr:NAD(P)-dependent oxidoreductase [Roseivivax sp.]
MPTRYDTILLTGAAGRLGSQLRRALRPLAGRLRLADMEKITDLAENEESVAFDLADKEAAVAACEGVDAIVHFGGVAMEAPWDVVLNSNMLGSYNIYEGARQHGAKRVIYASSVHAIGYHALEDHIDANAPHRPDGLYGLSKCFAEDLGRLYWDKFGIETVALRIFSSFPEPADRRMLWSWLSFEDCNRLTVAALTAPRVGFTISFGMSDNRHKPVDNRLAGHLGFYPQDNTEGFRAAVEARTAEPDASAPAVKCLGGWFVDMGHPDDPAKE